MSNPMYFWLGAVVLFGIVEAATAGLTVIWFAAGALIALISAALGAKLWLQVTIFIVASAAALVLTRPLAKRFISEKKVPTNADRVIGQTAKVTETIDNLAPSGAVYIDGKTWTARSVTDRPISVGKLVTVQAMEGVKLIVKEEEP